MAAKTDPSAQAVPDRMNLIAEWDTPEHDHMELYADAKVGDGRLVATGRGGSATAALLADTRQSEPMLAWMGELAERPKIWQNAQAGIIRARLAEHRS